MQSLNKPEQARLESLDIYASYKKSKFFTMKASSYFQVYEELFSRFRNQKITFVEVGVQHGGSLFMWRDYFGPEARIIGIDLNPLAKQWESAGFEIHIGDQGDPRFWKEFFSEVGDVDILLDDGGHTNEQQIVTAHHCIPHIRNQGMLIVEDTGTSYLRFYGNPSRYSFINYVKRMIDHINSRFMALQPSDHHWAVYSLGIYESIVCFHIDREKCFVGSATSNDGITTDAENFWQQGTGFGKVAQLRKRLQRRFAHLKRFRLIRAGQGFFFDSIRSLHFRYRSRKLKKYFS